MEIKTKILSVDDNEQNRKVIEMALEKHFDVVSSDGNDPFVELVSVEQPKIILLDIMLEGKTGFDLCKNLRDSDENSDIFVIFVSALHSIEDKLKAYAMGGDDYICKPVDIFELNEKLKGIEKRISNKEQLSDQCKQASNVAFTLMKNASELGLLIGFFTDSLNISSTDELSQKIAGFFEQFDIKFSLEFRLDNSYIHFPTNINSTLENEILELGRSAPRIVTFGRNILFNSPWCSILVKHLPIDDEDFVGRVRDHFAILLSIVDSRLMFLDSENKRKNERENALTSLSSVLAKNFQEIKQSILTQENVLLKLLSELTMNMDQKTLSLGLSEEQEVELAALFEETKEQFSEVLGSSVMVDNKLRDITQLLSKIH